MKFLLLFFLVLVLLISPNFIAQETPNLPTIVQGDAIINGKLAPAGTLVSAKVGDEILKEYTLTESGKYVLTISSDEFNNDDVNLYVNNILTTQTVTLESGQIVDADLNIKVKVGLSKTIIAIILGFLILLIAIIFVVKKKK